ncbi:MAG: AMP-binding protein [Thermoanaerobaculia bacterium]|nr:AMP-binding protein [Thermoanaerobaculia bacterium]
MSEAPATDPGDAEGATLWRWLERAAEIPAAGVRLLDRRESERWLPWQEVLERARAVGLGLRELETRPGDRIALVFPTGAEFLAAFFGALAAGAVPVPLYPPNRLGRLDEYRGRTTRMLRAARTTLVLSDARIHGALEKTAVEAGVRLGGLRLADLPSAERPSRGASSPSPSGPGDLALVQFSSGTTAAPKPVALSHRAVTAQVRLLSRFWPDSGETTHSGVSWLPLYHDMGLIGAVFSALERPGVVTLLTPEAFLARPALWLRAISDYRATISPAPDFGYHHCLDRVRDRELDGVDLSSWTVALDGAETVSADLLRAFADRFRPRGFTSRSLTPVYGLAEATLAVTFSPPREPWRSLVVDREALAAEGRVRPTRPGGREREVVSVGRPLPGFEVEVRNDGEALPEDRVGRLWIRGPSLMEGYLHRPDLTAKHLVRGWLDTGDLGFLHGGDLFVTGRAKDVVVVRGRNHDPQEIEAALRDLPGARPGSAIAVSRPRDRGGEGLLLLLEHHRKTSADERRALPRAARAAVLERIGVSPDVVEVLPPATLPRTSSGKLRRGEALTRWTTGRLRSRDRAEPPRTEIQGTRSTADGEGP